MPIIPENSYIVVVAYQKESTSGMFFVFDTYNILSTLVISFIIQAVFFIFAASFKTDKVTDFSYSLSFLILSVLLLVLKGVYTMPRILLASFIVAWALRLGAYLLARILKIGKDSRFDDKRGDIMKFLAFWILQACTVWLVMLPAVVFLGTDVEIPLTWLSILGIVLWAGGFILEIVADAQKYSFKNKPENRGRWIDSGLWRFSRHPNYFGESLLWWGLFIFIMPVLEGYLYLVILGPVSITLLLLFVSGIPLLEKSADERYGGREDYREYKRRTSLFIPLPPKKR